MCSEQVYLDLVSECIETGDYRLDRTGVGVYSLFGKQIEFDLEKGFPLLTTKKLFVKGILKELLWMLKGQTDSKILEKQGVHFWNANGSREFLDSRGFVDRDEGDLGPIYGFQWRHFGAEYKNCYVDYSTQGVDQISRVVNDIKHNPSSRRLIVNSWNVSQIDKMALPPCHCLIQFFVRGNVDRSNYLDCKLYQRSADLALGVPFNIASYAFLVHVVAKWTGLIPGKFIHSFGDVHVYSNHVDPLKMQLQRSPLEFPKVQFVGKFALEGLRDIDADEWCNSFEIVNYRCYDTIKMEMAV
jgi:thymidylate synthase